MREQIPDIRGDFPLESSHLGCSWNLFRILMYHHWDHVKRRFKHKRRTGDRHVGGKQLFSVKIICIKVFWGLDSSVALGRY